MPLAARFVLLRILVATASTTMVAGLLAAPVEAVSPSIRWDSEGMAEISAPPFTFGMEMTDYSSPQEITHQADVRVDFTAAIDIEVCSATVRVTPLKDGIEVGEPAFLDAEDSFEYVSVWFPVDTAGSYALRIEGSYETSASLLCSTGSTASTPYASTIELFRITRSLPGPPSTRRVGISSSGSHTLVANTSSKSRSLRITFTIRDPEMRTDLLYSICMTDTSDCWFEDAKLKPTASTHKTATGWIRTWDFWWERTSPSSCLSYYWGQPDVSVILVVSNSEGRVLGRKKHGVKLTCRG